MRRWQRHTNGTRTGDRVLFLSTFFGQFKFDLLAAELAEFTFRIIKGTDYIWEKRGREVGVAEMQRSNWRCVYVQLEMTATNRRGRLKASGKRRTVQIVRDNYSNVAATECPIEARPTEYKCCLMAGNGKVGSIDRRRCRCGAKKEKRKNTRKGNGSGSSSGGGGSASV